MYWHRLAWLCGGLLLLAPPARAQRTYTGAEACAACHEVHSRWNRGGAHESAAIPAQAAKGPTGCETCHGPGSAHAENPSVSNIVTFRLESAAVRSAQCLQCHGRSPSMGSFRRGDHGTRKVACDDCHSPSSESFHRMRSAADTMARAEPALCYQCHTAQRAAFALPFHHPVNEGHLKCSQCHEQHGGVTLRHLRTRDAEAVCGQCHQDKQGPFVFEHPAGRSTGCSACHRPHGGANPKMLTRSDTFLQCLECHPTTPRNHDVSQARFRNCTACHARIHGSNLSRLLLE
jgi:DmsE family decaheme c-type cytochrome